MGPQGAAEPEPRGGGRGPAGFERFEGLLAVEEGTEQPRGLDDGDGHRAGAGRLAVERDGPRPGDGFPEVFRIADEFGDKPASTVAR